MFAFQTHHLVKRYGSTAALNGLNMNVPKGSIYGFLGLNGAGKTTTFCVAAQFVHASSGTFTIQGQLGMLPQDARFYHGRSVVSQLKFFGLLSGVESQDIDREVKRVLELVGLADKGKSAVQK
ncbi:MAG: ATP-binding cassette domain-containing protein, partial [Candidatus Harrisonbacteria bacterium]|nr:ATP-binding cassette domain-containing protein [Candidatus Harrisonbacteria bacterium]